MPEGIYNRYTGYHNRRSMRLKNYDYSRPGSYFVTVCLHDRKQRLLGRIIDGKMVENEMAGIVRKWWYDLPDHYPHVSLDEFIIMPDHIHGIIKIGEFIVVAGSSRPKIINSNNEKNISVGRGDRAPTLRNMVGYFKYQSTKQINACCVGCVSKIWQRNYYDHIICDNKSLYYIRNYISNNPIAWNNGDENHLVDAIQQFYSDAEP